MESYLVIALCLALLPTTQQQFQEYGRYCPNVQQCYITPSLVSWSVKSYAGNAQQWCKSMNATLPIADDSVKQAALLEAMENLGLTEVWIAATAVYDEWTWVDGTKYGDNISQSTASGDFVAGLYMSAANWYYMYMYMPGVVTPYGSPAINSGIFICQFSNPEACNKTELPSVATEDGCYILYNNFPQPWFSARNHCLENGGDLATFHNLSDAYALVNYLEPMSWVGLRNRWWKWHDSVTGALKEVLFTQWAAGYEPRNTKGFDCISTTSNGWKETNCTENVAFICQEANVFLPDNSTVSSMDRSESLAQIGSCKSVGVAAGIGVGIPLLVIAAIIIVVIIKRDKLRTQRPMSSTTTYQNKSIYGNESVVNVAANKSSESSTHDDRAYEGLDSSTRKAVEEHYEALEV